MKSGSAKAKGRRLQNFVVEQIYKTFPELEEGDVKPAIMGESGIDVKLSPAARRIFPFGVECKNQEKLSIWKELNQTTTNAKTEKLKPALIFKRNRTDPWVAIPLGLFLKMARAYVKINRKRSRS